MAGRYDYGDNIEGIPLKGDLPQVKGSAVPNRDESFTLANPQGEQEPYTVDYFDAETAELGDPKAPYVADKEDEQWSAGLADEENSGDESFEALDAESVEAMYPETQPLHVEGDVAEQSDDEFADVELHPDNIQRITE